VLGGRDVAELQVILGLPFERVVLAQRMADPLVGHQDTRHVGVAVEADAEQVEHLALVPVGRHPDAAGRRRLLPSPTSSLRLIRWRVPIEYRW